MILGLFEEFSVKVNESVEHIALHVDEAFDALPS